MPGSLKKSAEKGSKPDHNVSPGSTQSTSNTGSINRSTRKRKRETTPKRVSNDFEYELQGCNMNDAIEIETKLRKVARKNSLSEDEMFRLLQKFVKNEHILALVTLKAEDSLAKEKQEAEQRAVIITEMPTVPKLTRAKARELNCGPGIKLPSLNEAPVKTEIEALIHDDLNSDEDDGEYMFKEDDFMSDDDPSTAASDFDSNPCTPQTPLTAGEDSPIKLSADGCFKIPIEKPKKSADDLRIATRTRSKLCLQQTTIEDIQSEFVPPDVEQCDLTNTDVTANDTHWLEFLNDFTKPLNSTIVGDDDDPDNDPEYVAAEKEMVDAEELRDVNISKKELNDLVTELFESLLQEGISLDNIDVETPQRFLDNSCDTAEISITETACRELSFNVPATYTTEPDYNIQPNIVSAPTTNAATYDSHNTLSVSVPIANISKNFNTTLMGQSNNSGTIITMTSETLEMKPELVAVPIPDQPNCFQLAKILQSNDTEQAKEINACDETITHTQPYDINFTSGYISVRRHLYAEYADKFEHLRYVRPSQPDTALATQTGFTKEQHDLLQQQLRIHVQMLTQTYMQTYSHPMLYPMAENPRSMLEELRERSKNNVTFNAWNLPKSLALINKWEADLNDDNQKEDNAEMMDFIYQETDLCDGLNRQVTRLPPRIMNMMLDSDVFMYPQYLPRMAFSPKKPKKSWYAPAEYQLIAMGLEKYLNQILCGNMKIHKSANPIGKACKRMVNDLIHGKTPRRLLHKVFELRRASQYNPVQYYFEHKCAPHVEQFLWGFENGIVLTPRQRYNELPLGWKIFIDHEEQIWHKGRKPRWDRKQVKESVIKSKEKLKEPAKGNAKPNSSYYELVQEVIGDNVTLPENFVEPAIPFDSITCTSNEDLCDTTHAEKFLYTRNDESLTKSVTVNINYIFGGLLNKQGGEIIPNNTISNGNCLPTTETVNEIEQFEESLVPTVNINSDDVATTAASNIDVNAKNIRENTPAQNITDATSAPTPKAGAIKNLKFAIYKRRIIKRNALTRYKQKRVRSSSRKLKSRCLQLSKYYIDYQSRNSAKYAKVPCVQYFYKLFYALDCYTKLLKDLKMFCRNKITTCPVTSTINRKRTQQIDNDEGSGSINIGLGVSVGVGLGVNVGIGATRARKSSRQEEYFRHMLQPDGSDETERKDALFAQNFYDKVEEVLLSAQLAEDFEKFNHLLKVFDPHKHKVGDLYYKIEQLLAPVCPELVEVFLNFLLPEEAADIGKYFEHFMITNASTFINKLNIYFNKQPAQIRKIYTCLSDLAEQSHTTMKQIENKILPLLKGNQFLIDWFMQQFPQSKPPSRLLPSTEQLNLNEVQNTPNGTFRETIPNKHDSPMQQEQPACHLKYLNGRIFYGTKILLPAKLTFTAKSLCADNLKAHIAECTDKRCAHGIRDYGNNLLATTLGSDYQSDNDAERSEDDNSTRTIIIDTSCDEDNTNCTNTDLCDETALRGHAVRLNSSYYGNFNATNTSTPVTTPNFIHHPNAKRLSINFNETSPRKQQSASTVSVAIPNSPVLNGTTSSIAAIPINMTEGREKRKSPIKKMRSPTNTINRPTVVPRLNLNVQPMVVIHEQGNLNPIACAKRLQNLIEAENRQTDSGAAGAAHNENGDTKVNIVACAKYAKNINDVAADDISEEEELLALTQTCPTARRGASELQTETPVPQHVITTQFDSDEDNKLDVVATLANWQDDEPMIAYNLQKSTCETTLNTNNTDNLDNNSNASNRNNLSLPRSWTRDEDKIILVEMKLGARDREQLLQRIVGKLQKRSLPEVVARHQFLMDFLSKLQGK